MSTNLNAGMSRGAAQVPPISTMRALTFVYAGYLFRYAYLLVLIPFYGRVLGAEEYGRLLAAMSLYTLVWVLAEYGFPTVGARDTAATTDRSRIAEIFGRHTMGRLWMALPGLALGVGGTLLSPVLREDPVLGVLAVANGLLAAFNLGWFFQGTMRFRTSVMLEVLGFAINLPVILLMVHGPGDSWIVLATLLGSNLFCTAIAYGIALRSMDCSALRWAGGLSLLRESAALFAHKGLTMMMASSSTFLFSLFATPAQLGWYGAAERLATVGLSLMQPANHVLIGTVARQISRKDSEGAAFRLMRRSLIAMTGLGFAMLVGTLIFADVAVPMILGPDFGPTVPLLLILSLMFPFAALTQVISGYVLIPLRHDRLVSLVSLLGALVTVVLIVFLGRAFDGAGVAWARTLGYTALAVVMVEVLRRQRLIGKLWSTR